MRKIPPACLLFSFPLSLFAAPDPQNGVLLKIGVIALIPFLIPFFTILLINLLKKIFKQELSPLQKRYIIFSGWIGALLVTLFYLFFGRSDFPWQVLYGASIPFSLIGYAVSIARKKPENLKPDPDQQ